MSASTSPSVEGSSDSTCGSVESSWAMAHDVVERDGADLAHRLGDDQVHLELAQLERVELVERLAGTGALAHGGVDRRRAEALGNDAAGEVGEIRGLGRVVTLMGDGDDVVADAEGEQHLGRGWDQRSDTHRRRGWHV